MLVIFFSFLYQKIIYHPTIFLYIKQNICCFIHMDKLNIVRKTTLFKEKIFLKMIECNFLNKLAENDINFRNCIAEYAMIRATPIINWL